MKPTNISDIPDVKDRIDRLEVIAQTFSELHNTSRMEEAIRLGTQLANSLDGIKRDTVLASFIQTAHEIDKDIAAEITGEVDDPNTSYELDVNTTAYDLSRAPHKLTGQFLQAGENDEIVSRAIDRMMRPINSNKAVSYQLKTVLDWLAAGAHLESQLMLNI